MSKQALRFSNIIRWQRLSALYSATAREARLAIINGDKLIDTKITCDVASKEAHNAGIWARVLSNVVEA